MRVTFAFVCLFAAVSCLPPPPPPPIALPNYRPTSNYNIYNNRGVYSNPSKVNTQYQPTPKANTQYQPPPHANNRYQLQPPKASNRYQLQPKANNRYQPPPKAVNQYQPPPQAINQYQPPPQAINQYQPPPKAINQYQPPPRTYQPPSSNTNKYTPPRTNSVPVVNINQAPPPAALHSWLKPRTPAAGPVGLHVGSGNCQYCARRPPEPRCGINNVTYVNDCFLDCEFMKQDCDGPCPCRYQHPPNSGCWCRREDHDPICAVGAGPLMASKTFASQCEAACERMRFVYDGPCWERG